MNATEKFDSEELVRHLNAHVKNRGKLQTIFAIREFLQDLGSYENIIDGLLGEVYAEEKIGMTKASANEKAIDGRIDEKTIQVKTKGGAKIYKDSQHYISLNVKNEELVDLLLMVIIKDKQIHSHGPCERIKIIGRTQKDGKTKRYYLNDMKKVLDNPN
jgi:hypothetical protein